MDTPLPSTNPEFSRSRMATNVYLQTLFFTVAIIFTLDNIRQRFFTKKVCRSDSFYLQLRYI